MHNQTDALSQIRQHLSDKSASELVDLLMDLLQQVDETTRRRFWEQLAPPGLATADLRYSSPEAFLADVEAFVASAAAGEYYDEEAAEYFGQDPVDRDYHVKRGYIDEYDIEYHIGMSTLRTLLVETGSYYAALEVARQLGESATQEYTAEVAARLQQQANRRPLLCQVYLHAGQYESAFRVVEDLSGYGALDELKLVAKAYLLTALHGQPVDGEYLAKVRTDLDDSVVYNEYARFLRDHLPMPDLTPAQRALHIQRAEHLYRNILETHVAAGSKRYKTAAYYCALLAEIAVHAEHVDEFIEWYEDLLTRYSRRRSLRKILNAKTRPVLDQAAQGG